MGQLYKTICEVKLMHEFHLTNKDGNSSLALLTQEERLDSLNEVFKENRESINDDIILRFPSADGSSFNNLKLLPSYSGFRILTKVSAGVLSDNTTVYKPLVPFTEGRDIFILVYQKNNSLDNYTNSALSLAIPAIYFFSNTSLAVQGNFPFLTAPIPTVDLMHSYQQGELASFATNDIKSFTPRITSEDWIDVKGIGFANEADRLLVPSRFYYSFKKESGIKSVEYSLKNKAGDIIKTLEAKNDGGLEKVWLDFSDVSKTGLIDNGSALPEILFSLEVRGDNGFSRIHPLLFNDSFYRQGLWAVIHIRPVITNFEFGLFANDGYLKTRKIAGTNNDKHPVFEIPFKSRSAYWRYKNNAGKSLELTSELQAYLDLEDGALVSKLPKSLAQINSGMTPGVPGSSKIVPAPVNYEPAADKKNNSGRLFFDINVPRSDMFHPPPS